MTYAQYLLFLKQQQEQQGGDDSGINSVTQTPNLAVGQKPPSALLAGIMSLIAPPVGLVMQAQRFADQGQLPFGLNKIFASRASGDVEVGMPQTIQTSQPFVDEVALTGGDSGSSSFDSNTGGTFGSSVDNASAFSDYS